MWLLTSVSRRASEKSHGKSVGFARSILEREYIRTMSETTHRIIYDQDLEQ